MKLTVNDKKILVAFGCPDLEDTIDRLWTIASISPVPETRKTLFALALKLTSAKSRQNYQDFFYILKLYSEEYRMKAAQIQQFQPDLMEDYDGATDEG